MVIRSEPVPVIANYSDRKDEVPQKFPVVRCNNLRKQLQVSLRVHKPGGFVDEAVKLAGWGTYLLEGRDGLGHVSPLFGLFDRLWTLLHPPFDANSFTLKDCVRPRKLLRDNYFRFARTSESKVATRLDRGPLATIHEFLRTAFEVSRTLPDLSKPATEMPRSSTSSRILFDEMGDAPTNFILCFRSFA